MVRRKVVRKRVRYVSVYEKFLLGLLIALSIITNNFGYGIATYIFYDLLKNLYLE